MNVVSIAYAVSSLIFAWVGASCLRRGVSKPGEGWNLFGLAYLLVALGCAFKAGTGW